MEAAEIQFLVNKRVRILTKHGMHFSGLVEYIGPGGTLRILDKFSQIKLLDVGEIAEIGEESR